MNRMDNLILTNFKMIKKDILYMIAVILATGLVIWMDYAGGIFLLPLMGAMLLVVFKICKTLFYDSIFGETAYLYISLPVSAEEIVVSRIATVISSVVVLDVIGMVFLMVNTYFFAANMSDLSAVEQTVEYIRQMLPLGLGGKTALGGALMFLRMVVSPAARLCIVFLGVCAYQVLASRKYGEVFKHTGVIAAGLFFLFTEDALNEILRLIGITGYIESSAVVIIVMGIVIVAAGIGCIKLLKNHYSLQ